jgi:predicted Zn-dependent peptidase
MVARSVTTGIATEQVHEIIGGRAYALRHDHYVPFVLLNNLLGGPAMGSMLNYNIRERHGLAYNITSFYNPYTDVGQWGVYFACEEKNLARIRKLVNQDLNVLCDKPLTDTRLRQAKHQLLGQLTLGYENLLGQALSLAKDLLDFGEILPFTDYIKAIEAVTASEIQEAAVDIFRSSPLVTLTYLREA